MFLAASELKAGISVGACDARISYLSLDLSCFCELIGNIFRPWGNSLKPGIQEI